MVRLTQSCTLMLKHYELLKQNDVNWSPVAYIGRQTSNKENIYSSY